MLFLLFRGFCLFKSDQWFVLHLYFPSCLGQKTEKGRFWYSGQVITNPPVFTKHGGGFTLIHFIAERQAGKV